MSVSPIRVGLFHVEKDAFGCFERPNCAQPGADTEIVILVLRILQLPYVIIDLRKEFDIAYDFGSLQENGSWSGVMKLLVEEKIDICGLSMRITEDRREAVLFSYPTRYFQSTFIIDRPTSKCPKTFLFHPFSLPVWISLICVILLSFASIYLLRVVSLTTSTSVTSKTLRACFMKAFLFPVPPDRRPFAFLGILFLFLTFTVTQMYQSKMYSFLASATSFHIPFFSFCQAMEWIRDGKGFFTAFDTQTMLCPTPTACDQFEELAKKVPIRRHTSQEGIELDLDNGGIYQSTIDGSFLSSQVSWLDRATQERIIIKDDEGPMHYVAYSFSKSNKKLRNKFNDALMNVLPAVPLITGGHGYDTAKSPFGLKYMPPPGPLSLRTHLAQLFRLYVFGSLLCLTVFIAELIVFHLPRREKPDDDE